MTADPIRVHALIDDLFFRAKVEATAAAAGVPVAISRTAEELAAELDRGAGRATVLVDLGHAAADPPAVIRALKARAGAPVVVAFGAHRDGEAFRAARDAGADRVLARSALSERLPELLREAVV